LGTALVPRFSSLFIMLRDVTIFCAIFGKEMIERPLPVVLVILSGSVDRGVAVVSNPQKKKGAKRGRRCRVARNGSGVCVGSAAVQVMGHTFFRHRADLGWRGQGWVKMEANFTWVWFRDFLPRKVRTAYASGLSG